MRELYGASVLDHYRNPRNHGPLAHATSTAEGHNPLCGDRVRIELIVEGDMIREAAFTANACVICTASASILTERLSGAAVSAVSGITDDQAVDWLEATVTPARRGCATLPIRTARRALQLTTP